MMAEKKRTKSIKVNAILNIIRQCCHIIIPLIVYPYVSRILGSTNLGKYSFSSSLVNLVTTVACLGIPTYAIREGARLRNNKDQLEKFTAEIFSINLAALLITAASLLIIMNSVERLQRDSILTYILSISIFTNVLGRDWINNIYEDFLFITVRYIVFELLAVALVFMLVHNENDYIAYTVIMLVATSGPHIANVLYTKKYIPLKFTLQMNLRKHLKPILYLFGVTLAIQVYIHSDITVLGFFRPDDEVGVYTLASKIYTIVKALLNAVIIVIIPRVSNYLGTGAIEKYNHILNKLKKTLYVMIFPCVVGLFAESENVLRLIGGSEYLSGATALRILCIALVFAVFGCFYAQGVLVPNRRDEIFFIATVISAIENIVFNIIIIPICGMAGAAITTVIAECIVFAICMHYSKDVFEEKKDMGLISVAVGCVVIFIICYALNTLKVSYIIELFMSIVSSCIVYIAILYFMRNTFMHEMIDVVVSNVKREK